VTTPILPLVASAFGDSLAPSFASNLLQVELQQHRAKYLNALRESA
jgi:hypothetical protein